MRHDEDTLQKNCVRWFGYAYPSLWLLLHHSPNGGARNPREGAKFKAMGVRPGWPDLQLAVARGKYHALYIELKTPTGRLSDNQKIIAEELMAQGNAFLVVRSLEQFIEAINHYLSLP